MNKSGVVLSITSKPKWLYTVFISGRTLDEARRLIEDPNGKCTMYIGYLKTSKYKGDAEFVDEDLTVWMSKIKVSSYFDAFRRLISKPEPSTLKKYLEIAIEQEKYHPSVLIYFRDAYEAYNSS